jgi:hypothetical protein
MKIVSTFTKGKMNQDLDERLIPEGEYITAQNIRSGSSETTNVGAVEKIKGSTQITTLKVSGTQISALAKCIGAYRDDTNDRIYWFVHDEDPMYKFGVCDLIVSFSPLNGGLTYHVIDEDRFLNFSYDYPINGVSMIEDLLYFTDNLNSPKKINVKYSYSDISNGRLEVIVSPPSSAPATLLQQNSTASNYIEDRFFAFAYRYKYENGDYSALSQFSDIAFVPKLFGIDPPTMLNDGMVNLYNQVEITYNTGNKWVTEIDICVKDSQSNEIFLIETVSKSKDSIGDNLLKTVIFSNNRAYSTLPSTEWFRLYDNVPRRALSQIIMGNRLFYGNYVEGYDISTKFNYAPTLISETSVANEVVINTTLASYSYAANWYQTVAAQTVSNASFSVDMTGRTQTPKGAVITFDIDVQSNRIIGGSGLTQKAGVATITFEFKAFQDYNSLDNLITSTEFKAALGAVTIVSLFPITNIPVNCGYPSWADKFVCWVGGSRDSYFTRVVGGNQVVNNGLIVTRSGNVLTFTLPAVGYEATGPAYRHEYFNITYAPQVSISYSGANSPGATKSLHSNRTYQLGMVYMDDYGRSSTVQFSKNSTIDIPASASVTRNYIRATIPKTQLAPTWATKYKWVLKATKAGYETIYANVYYPEGDSGKVWVKLDGESQNKIEVGDTLVVKRDSSGATSNLLKAKVLDKEAKPDGWLPSVSAPAGVYMSLKPEGWSAKYSPDNNRETGYLAFSSDDQVAALGHCYARIPLFSTVGLTTTRWAVPAGATVRVYIWVFRLGRNCGGNTNNCGRRESVLDITKVAGTNYANFKDFWEREGIDVANMMVKSDGGCPDINGQNTDVYSNVFLTAVDAIPAISNGENKYQFAVDAPGDVSDSTKPLYLTIRNGTPACGRRDSRIEAFVEIRNNDQFLAFETEPNDALPNVFYENNEVFTINNKLHSGNVQTQTALLSSISNLGFYDCWTFANGVESYKIRDSIVGRTFGLGQRVHSSSEVPYKEEHRSADLTYSGVYNRETNVNKLNEFNAGLFNFKSLEIAYGSIQKLHPRETDILALQEDRVSKVLVSKGILSDVSGNNALTSVPEVLGNQVIVSQEYGISKSPESFSHFGDSVYFTDIRRGAVIKLVADQMTVISNIGMQSYFRDKFKSVIDAPIRGGYDPYLKDYVLHIGDNTGTFQETVKCGFVSKTMYSPPGTNVYYLYVDVGTNIGSVSVGTSIANVLGATALVYYNSVLQHTLSLDVNNSVVVNKNLTSVTQVLIEIYPAAPDIELVFDISVGCVVSTSINVYLVTVASPEFNDQSIQHYYNDQDSYVIFSSTTSAPASQFELLGDVQQGGWLPQNSGIINLYSVKNGDSSYTPQTATDRFGILRTNTVYSNTTASVNSLLGAATFLSFVSDTEYEPFTAYKRAMTLTSSGSNLYLIWDYRRPTLIDACYVAGTDPSGACCGCTTVCPTCFEYQASGVYLSRWEACAAPIVMTIYGKQSGLAVGAMVYFDSACSFPAYPGYYKINSGTNYIQVNGSGVILTSTTC